MAIKYKPGGVTVTIGKSQDISLPTRVFRGRATCMHFDTDKSFLLPPSVPGARNIVAFFNRHPGATMLVNGHTDLEGDAQYNLQLSNERAAAVASYVQDKVDDWLAWYDAPSPSKRWSYTEDQQMLSTVSDASGAPYYAGPITGVNDAATSDATQRFQSDNGLTVDGQPGPETRRALIVKYMALEGTSLSPDVPMVLHGCGMFHPIDPQPATTGAIGASRSSSSTARSIRRRKIRVPRPAARNTPCGSAILRRTSISAKRSRTSSTCVFVSSTRGRTRCRTRPTR